MKIDIDFSLLKQKIKGELATDEIYRKLYATDASAYREVQILNAEGEVARFVNILEKYIEAPDITRTRLYIETMEEILPEAKKILLFNDQSDTLNFLDLDSVLSGGDSK